MKKTVVVAMSGGVDSSVAAALLKKQGYEVIGLTMCFNLAERSGSNPSCCGLSGIEDARRVCHNLGIRHYVINLDKAFYNQVILNFYQEYLSGRTPNPCVRCNQFIKFDLLLKKAINLGAHFLATGHYAKITKSKVYLLKKSGYRKKDQSYFLYRLTQGQLKRVIFPLSDLSKPQVRQIAKEMKLNVAQKQDSQEICFLPEGKYRDLIKAKEKVSLLPANIVDKEGNILGTHRGIASYTIGQRHGLGVTRSYPLYVIKIDAKNNRITVGGRKDSYQSEFLIKDKHFISQPFKKKVEIKVRIRYNHKEAPAIVYPSKGKFRIVFKRPQFAITPGQSAVFYDKDVVLGGGIIEKVIR